MLSRFNSLSFCILHFAFLILFSCQQQDKKADTKKVYASLSDSTHYVGINTCRQCHQNIYETFIETGMGKSFDVASRQKSSARFDEHALVYDKFKGFYYRPFWKEDSLYLKEFRMEGKDTVYERTEKINYIIGSGQHTNSHMTNVNGYVYQVPATFYTQKGHWDLPPGFEEGHNTRFGRKIEVECMTCHNAYPKMVEGSENKYTSIPNGIDCERCHGPGSEHVKQKMQGKLVDITKEIDYSIVNPAKLPIALQLDICQRCHIQGNAVLKEGKTFYDFKPGMPLSDVMNVYMPVYKGDEESHIMASHVERLKLSPCFVVSNSKVENEGETGRSGEREKDADLYPYRNGMTCVTCHNPHVSVKATDKEVFNKVCTSCHHARNENHELKSQVYEPRTPNNELICTEDKKKRLALQDNCVHCHMPKNGTTDIPHVSVTDHYIRKPLDTAAVKKIKEFVTLACINNANDDNTARGNAFISYYEKFSHNPAFLDSAKRYFNDATDEDVRKNLRSLIHIAYLRDDFQSVAAYAERVKDIFSILKNKNYSNEDAWTLYRIGESYRALNNTEKTLAYFQRAVQLQPFNLDFINKLAQVQVQAQRTEEARRNFEFIIKENPRYASAYISLGYLILSVDQNIAQADRYYDMALALEPDNEQALLNKAGTLMYLDRKKEAVVVLKRLLKINPNRSDVKKMLALVISQ
jgi:predicted CXXCH cytochrome family protein